MTPSDSIQPTEPPAFTMGLRSIAGHISGIAGVLTLLSNLWQPDLLLERAITNTITVSIAIYLLLLITDLILYYILKSATLQPSPAQPPKEVEIPTSSTVTDSSPDSSAAE